MLGLSLVLREGRGSVCITAANLGKKRKENLGTGWLC